MSRRVFDESFRKMAIELSYSKGSLKEVADDLVYIIDRQDVNYGFRQK